MVLNGMLILFGLSLVIYTGFMLRNAWFLGRLPEEYASFDIPAPFVSVLVPARNEADHLPDCLQALLNQDYPAHRYEIILIDDQSEDATAGIGKLFSVRHANLRFFQTTPDQQPAHKKGAISLGVSHAHGAIILQTDADCRVPPGWISAMTRSFKPQTGLVAGPVFLQGDANLFAKLQSLEGLGMAGIGAGSLLAGKPNMVNGANLGYRKEAFLDLGGFEGIDTVASGDDELLMQKVHLHPEWEVGYCGRREAIVTTSVQPSWSDFRQQRLRWVSKARQYLDRRINLIQAIAYLAYLSIPVWIGTSLYTAELRYAALAVQAFLLLWGANTLVAYRAGVFFHTLHLLQYSLLLQLVHLPYVLWIGIRGNFVHTYQWKGRTVS